jgi:hypothetical protein
MFYSLLADFHKSYEYDKYQGVFISSF